MDDINENENPRIKQLENEIHNLKEQLQNYIPRRRVRRVFKDLKKILEQDLPLDDGKYLNILKNLIKKIEIDGKAESGVQEKEAIEYILSRYEIQEELESDLAYNAVLYSDNIDKMNKIISQDVSDAVIHGIQEELDERDKETLSTEEKPLNEHSDANMTNQYGVPINIQGDDNNESE